MKKQRVIISHYSAFLLYRIARLQEYKIIYIKTRDIETFKPQINKIKSLIAIINDYFFDAFKKTNFHYSKLDILSFNSKQRSKSKFIKNHVCSNSLPSKSFVILKSEDVVLQKAIFDNIILPSPELLFVQLASQSHELQLAKIGFEICGRYVLTNKDNIGFKNVTKPLAHIANIADYIKQYSKSTNQYIKDRMSYNTSNDIQKAMQKDIQNKTSNTNQNYKKNRTFSRKIPKSTQCLSWLCDYSASPAETALYFILCAPRRLGGFGLKDFIMNCQIPVSKKAYNICNQPYIKPDIVNLHKKIALEYDSDLFHQTCIQDQKDKKRKDALIYDGWHVYTILKSQLKNPVTMTIIAKNIYKKCGLTFRTRSRSFFNKQYNLFNMLFGRVRYIK